MANETAKTPAVKADNKAVKKPVKPKKEGRFHPIRYFKEMFGELKKLTWLSMKDLASHTFAVLVFVVAMAAVIYVLDLAFSTGLSALSSIAIG